MFAPKTIPLEYDGIKFHFRPMTRAQLIELEAIAGEHQKLDFIVLNSVSKEDGSPLLTPDTLKVVSWEFEQFVMEQFLELNSMLKKKNSQTVNS